MSSQKIDKGFPVVSINELDSQAPPNDAHSYSSYDILLQAILSSEHDFPGPIGGPFLLQHPVPGNAPLRMWRVAENVPTSSYLEGRRTNVCTFNSSPLDTIPCSQFINIRNMIVEDIGITTEVGGAVITGAYPNGYRFPKKHTWGQSVVIGLRRFRKFVVTPLGFLVTIYCLNVVGWGAMIFFLLIGAAPAMCHPSCNDAYSARRIWIEIDAQVLTALFCVTAFGLIPWRFRDFYYLMRWRVGKNHTYHRKLAGIYRSWYRLPGSNGIAVDIGPFPAGQKNHQARSKDSQVDDDPPAYTAEELDRLGISKALPLPLTSIPDVPLTGYRAVPTKTRKLDIVVWMYLMNTLIQIPLCGIMWGMTRFNRPSWVTGFLISVGCLSGIVAGVVVLSETSRIKKNEGIPIKEYHVVESVEEPQSTLRSNKENV